MYQTWNGSVTESGLNAAEAKVQAQIQPVLDAAGVSGADLMSGQFSADHTGIDKVLDIVSISYDGSGTTATVTNTITNSSFTDVVTTGADDANKLPASDAANTTTALTDEQGINTVFSSLCSLYASSRPTYTAMNTWAVANMATDYLDRGESRDQMVSEWTLGDEGPGVGCTLTASIATTLAGLPPAYTKGYAVTMTYRDPSYTGTDSFKSQVVHDGAKWLWYGDRRWIDVDMKSEASRMIDSIGTTFYSGVNMYFNDNYSYGYNQGVRSMVVSVVVGTTTRYVVLGNQYPQPWYKIQSGCLSSGGGSQCWLDDAVISQITDNTPYTVRLCSTNTATVVSDPASCTALQTYTSTVGKKPLLKTQLTNAMFPTLTTPSSMSRTGMGWNDGFVQVTWTNPAQGGTVERVELGWFDGVNQMWSDQDLYGTTTTSVNLDTLGMTTVPQSAWLHMSRWGHEGEVTFSSNWSFYLP